MLLQVQMCIQIIFLGERSVMDKISNPELLQIYSRHTKYEEQLQDHTHFTHPHICVCGCVFGCVFGCGPRVIVKENYSKSLITKLQVYQTDSVIINFFLCRTPTKLYQQLSSSEKSCTKKKKLQIAATTHVTSAYMPILINIYDQQRVEHCQAVSQKKIKNENRAAGYILEWTGSPQQFNSP